MLVLFSKDISITFNTLTSEWLFFLILDIRVWIVNIRNMLLLTHRIIYYILHSFTGSIFDPLSVIVLEIFGNYLRPCYGYKYKILIYIYIYHISIWYQYKYVYCWSYYHSHVYKAYYENEIRKTIIK